MLSGLEVDEAIALLLYLPSLLRTCSLVDSDPPLFPSFLPLLDTGLAPLVELGENRCIAHLSFHRLASPFFALL